MCSAARTLTLSIRRTQKNHSSESNPGATRTREEQRGCAQRPEMSNSRGQRLLLHKILLKIPSKGWFVNLKELRGLQAWTGRCCWVRGCGANLGFWLLASLQVKSLRSEEHLSGTLLSPTSYTFELRCHRHSIHRSRAADTSGTARVSACGSQIRTGPSASQNRGKMLG